MRPQPGTTELARAMWAPLRHSMPPGNHLPDCLCGLLRLSVQDAQRVEKTPGYVLDMRTWHKPNGECQVCMAGAVLAMTMKIPRSYDGIPFDIEDRDQRKLYAIDSMRIGCLGNAFRQLYNDAPSRAQRSLLDSVGALIYGAFQSYLERARWSVYLDAASRLEAAGL